MASLGFSPNFLNNISGGRRRAIQEQHGSSFFVTRRDRSSTSSGGEIPLSQLRNLFAFFDISSRKGVFP
jgi:hypothetical protein